MNLDSISTVSDLVNQNAAKKLTHEEVYQLAEDNLAYPDAVRLAGALVSQLANFHQRVRMEVLQEGDGERAALWAADEGRLHCALMALEQITID